MHLVFCKNMASTEDNNHIEKKTLKGKHYMFVQLWILEFIRYMKPTVCVCVYGCAHTRACVHACVFVCVLEPEAKQPRGAKGTNKWGEGRLGRKIHEGWIWLKCIIHLYDNISIKLTTMHNEYLPIKMTSVSDFCRWFGKI